MFRFQEFFNLILVVIKVVDSIEWYQSEIIFAGNLENFEVHHGLNELYEFGVNAILFKNVFDGTCIIKSANVEALKSAARTLNISVLFDFSGSSSCFEKRLNEADEINKLVKHWTKEGIVGYRISYEVAKLLGKELEDTDVKLIVDEPYAPVHKNLLLLRDINNIAKLNEKSDFLSIGWHIQDHENSAANALNFFKILSPGFLVVDESLKNLLQTKFFEFRKLKNFDTIPVEFKMMIEEVFVLRRKLDKSLPSFIAIANIGSTATNINLEACMEDSDVHLKVAASSSLKSFYKEG